MCAKAFNSGWSNPIRKKFLTSHAPNFLNDYGDFYKQYQYQMEVWEKCNQDENVAYVDDGFGNVFVEMAAYFTETYYPPGKSEFFLCLYVSCVYLRYNLCKTQI